MATTKQPSKTKNGEMPADAKNKNTDGLHKFFIDGLKDIYWAEKALTKALPKMIKNVTSKPLADAITAHLEETKTQITRLEQVFASIDQKVVAKKCDAMEGLLKEATGIMEDTEKGSMRDAGIIAAGQKVEHYEIATYGTLGRYAQLLGLGEAQSLLEESLLEEKAADEKLTEVTPEVVMPSGK